MSGVEVAVSEAVAASSSIACAKYKPGQSKPRPSPGSGERVFYSSLWDEKGEKSDMALVWMVENGCFDDAQLKLYYPDKFSEARERLKIRASAVKH